MALRPLTTALRHLLAGAVTVAACLLLWTIIYLALLAWAMATGDGLGGPLAYPAGLLLTLIYVTCTSLLVFLPATLASETICRRKSLPPILAGIPITCAFATLIVLVIVATAAALAAPPGDLSVLPSTGILTATLLIPLGIYWWTSQFPSFMSRLGRRIRSKLRPAKTPPKDPPKDPPKRRPSILEP